MTSLVIGSDGFIGKPFCKFLEGKGEKVVRFDVARSKKEDARTAKLPLKNVDKVYFLAWDVGGSKYLYKKDLQMNQLKWNLDLMSNVFNQLEESGIPFMFASSQLVEESDTVYGATKRLGEVWTSLLGGVSVRIWNAYGFMEKDDIKSHVISDFVYQALKTKKIKMMTNGKERRQFTHITDLGSAFYSALHSENVARTVYDASSYEWRSILDVAKIVSSLTGAKIIAGDNEGHDPLPADNMGRIPGWLPSITLEDGIAQMVEQAKIEIKNGRKK